jgi:hypothetical protein
LQLIPHQFFQRNTAVQSLTVIQQYPCHASFLLCERKRSDNGRFVPAPPRRVIAAYVPDIFLSPLFSTTWHHMTVYDHSGV